MPTAQSRIEKLGPEYVKRFEKHAISELPSKAWKVRDPDKHEFWFYITWSPGSLVLNGDCDSMVLTHYYAMKTPEEAAAWANGAEYDYMMGKSDAEKVYCPEATAEHFGYHLFEDRCKKVHKKDCDECDRFRKCMNKLEKFIDDRYFRKLKRKTRADVVKFVHDNITESQDDAYDLFVHVFNEGSEMMQYRYKSITKTQYAAFQTWAKLVNQQVQTPLDSSAELAESALPAAP